MAFVDPLKQPQRFVHQADALIRQSMANPTGADPFAVIDAQLEASFDAVLASVAGPEVTETAGAPEPPQRRAAEPGHQQAALPPALASIYSPGLYPPMGVSSFPPTALAYPTMTGVPGIGRGLNALNPLTALSAANPLMAPQAAAPVQQASLGANLEPVIAEMSDKYHVPEWLIRNVIRAESGGDPLATSPVGAMGLMQLMPGTALELGVTDPYNARENIEGGAKYLRRMLDRFGGDVTKAVAAYNAGPGNVERFDGVPPFSETQAYVKRVLG